MSRFTPPATFLAIVSLAFASCSSSSSGSSEVRPTEPTPEQARFVGSWDLEMTIQSSSESARIGRKEKFALVIVAEGDRLRLRSTDAAANQSFLATLASDRVDGARTDGSLSVALNLTSDQQALVGSGQHTIVSGAGSIEETFVLSGTRIAGCRSISTEGLWSFRFLRGSRITTISHIKATQEGCAIHLVKNGRLPDGTIITVNVYGRMNGDNFSGRGQIMVHDGSNFVPEHSRVTGRFTSGTQMVDGSWQSSGGSGGSWATFDG